MNFSRSIVFYLGLFASLIVFAPISLVVWPLPYDLRYRIVTLWAHLNVWWLATCCGLRWRVTGMENIPDGPAIIMCKHQSAWETFALQKFFPPHVWVLKRELLWLPLFGWGLATLKPIAIDRKAVRRALRQVVEQGRDRLQRGLWITIFPEGTRVAPGQRVSYEVGGAYLAAKTGVPVVPVAHNAGVFWPRARLEKKSGVIDVVIGPMIESNGKGAAEINQLVEDWIEAACERLPMTP